MEVAFAALQSLSEPLRRGTPLPLSQLVEESRSRADIPNHLESKIYAKLKSNSMIQAEPPVLHFSGFELGKDYIKILKLINLSSEVMNIHIVPTQTKHFQTTYTKKHRLIPGLAYTLRIRFRPNEWRYFYDRIRVHCEGEENMFIPVHAYPVIDDLHIPPHIDLSAVPLGQSVRHAIPLRCSCPVDFEFQVYVIQPHEAFSVHPLTGVIPAKGEVNVIVTFRPIQYETSQVTIQLIISQFNSRPYICTITGSSTPRLALREPAGRKAERGGAVPAEHKGPPPATRAPPRRKTKYRSTKEADRSKTTRELASAKPGPKPLVDVCTPAGVAKMLIKDPNKLCAKDLREAMSCGSMAELPHRRMKEALFMKKVRQNTKEEQANHLRWQVHLGKDPVSEHTRKQIAEERESARHEYMVKRGDVRHEEDFVAGEPKLSSRRVLCEAGQAHEGAPSFQFYSSFQWELRRRALTLFQQAARKVVIRCRTSRRLTCLRKLSDALKNSPAAKRAEEEATCDPNISPDRVFPSAFPVFSDGDDLLARSDWVTLPVDPTDVTVTTHVPFFKLEVPQHYKVMGYRPVSAWDAFNSYIPTTLARPLRTGALDKPAPDEAGARLAAAGELRASAGQRHGDVKGDVQAKRAAGLTFSAPEALLRPFPANPLRIFNPAPGLQAYKPTPKYLESDPEFHLCPLPRYTIPESNTCDIRTQESHTQKKVPDREADVDFVLMTWKDFASSTSNCLSNRPALTSDCALRRSVDYSADTLPLTALPPPLAGPPDDLAPLTDKPCEGSAVQLTPEMIAAEFLSGEALVSNSNLTRGMTARHRRELRTEATYRSEFNQMGRRVTTRLKQLGVTDRASPSPAEDCQ